MLPVKRIRAIFAKQRRVNGIPQRVYLFRSGKFYKIGRSEDPQKRAAKLQTGIPFEVSVVHEIETNNPGWLEKSLHRVFEKGRRQGEWFELSERDVRWICSIHRIDGGPTLSIATTSRPGGRKRVWPPSTFNRAKRVYLRISVNGHSYDIPLGEEVDEVERNYREAIIELERNGYKENAKTRRGPGRYGPEKAKKTKREQREQRIRENIRAIKAARAEARDKK